MKSCVPAEPELLARHAIFMRLSLKEGLVYGAAILIGWFLIALTFRHWVQIKETVRSWLT